MALNVSQLDAVTEVVNIGFSRAAAALSSLVGQRIVLAAPRVEFYTLDEFLARLPITILGEATTVHQIFQGALSGNALLLLDNASASVLVDLISGGPGELRPLSLSDQEALIELGNIVLNAYLGSFGNLLKVHISFTVPVLHSSAVRDIFRSLTIEHNTLKYIMVISTEFRLTGGTVGGYVMLMMGLESIETLSRAVDQVRLPG
ncbi:MAG: chemotaxis protein CheC [Anaerolineales bacterium]|nr:chemotaxis protein CheC [Anaerolineales bacterium]